MATGRIRPKIDTRVYVDGYDMSGYTREIGPLSLEFDMPLEAALTDSVLGGLPCHAAISPGTLNGFMDNTTGSGLHVIMNAPSDRVVMVAQGIRAAPAAGDPVFCGHFEQTSYKAEGDQFVNVTIPFGTSYAAATTLAYTNPWGLLLHASAASTAANTSTVGVDFGAASTKGGFMCYHILAGDGTATLSVDESSGGAYTALSGATTGELTMAAGLHGIIALGTTASIKRYLRWQLALNAATTVTFVQGFCLGTS